MEASSDDMNQGKKEIRSQKEVLSKQMPAIFENARHNIMTSSNCTLRIVT